MSKHVDELLEDLAASLQVSPEHHETAERQYVSVGQWLKREGSTIQEADPRVYVQGSFRLGTVIRPVSNKEDYDLDIVCEMDFSKEEMTQADLKERLGRELQGFAESKDISPPEEKRRCWTLDYENQAQFHMDVLPALPDALRQSERLTARGFAEQQEWVNTAIAITDQEEDDYDVITEEWLHSNPEGYANWFRSRMGAAYDNRRRLLAAELDVHAASIPEYEIRTPLQSAIQILKWHRDKMFLNRPDEKPISIILTTLSAHAYQQEGKISDALFRLLSDMPDFIEDRNGIAYIANPTDPGENFADRWEEHPERKDAFYEWLAKARNDFSEASRAASREESTVVLRPIFGGMLTEAAHRNRPVSPKERLAAGLLTLINIFDPKHKKAPLWDRRDQGTIRIDSVVFARDGFRTKVIPSDSQFLPKGGGLTFKASTTVKRPFKVYWQIVNNGAQAEAAYDLRGGFNSEKIRLGQLTWKECTLYAGTHTAECFVVKNSQLAARSGQFIVNIS